MNKELKISYDILKNVIVDKSYVSIELNKVLNKIKDSDINSSLITKIVYGVLEKDILLDYFIAKFLKKSPKIEILIVLKIVAYVSKEINSIPSFALVNEMVNITKKIDMHQSGFVNAVSKKLISSNIVLPNKSDKIKYLSVKYNYPEWVIRELLKSKDLDFVENLVSKDLTTLTHIRVNLLEISATDFKKKLDDLQINYENSLYDYTLYVDYAKLLKTNLDRYYVVQGLPSIITCNCLDAKSGNVLDVCAAPGGKSMYLAQNKNLNIIACDVHKHRVDLIEKFAKSLKLGNIKCYMQDGTNLKNDWIEYFDYVLCDVPCSNLGVSRKKPDVFLNKTKKDVEVLSKLQYSILDNASKYVKKGGILQYSTCTIIDEENKNIIDKFIQNHKDFELTEINVDGLELFNDGHTYTFYPHLTNTEGFFIGRLRRK